MELRMRNMILVLTIGLMAVIPSLLLGGDGASAIATVEELEVAIGNARQALKIDGADTQVRRRLVELLLKKGADSEAEDLLREGLAFTPDSIPLLVEYSKLCKRQYRFDALVGLLEKAERLDPENWEVLELRAWMAMARMDFSLARQMLQKLEASNRSPAGALYGEAYLFYLENNQPEALALLERGRVQYPNIARFYYLLSQIQRSRKEYSAWSENIRKAVALDSFDADIRSAYAFMLVKIEGDMKGAEEQARIALRIDPFCLSAHSYLGNGGRSEEYDQGGGQLEEADELLVRRNFPQAEKLLKKALEKNPASIDAIIGMGTILYYRQDYDGALRWFFHGLEVSPGYGLAHYGIQQSLIRKLDGINVHLPALLDRFEKAEIPTPEYLEDVFVNYRDLAPDMQKIIRMTVAPLSRYLKTLKMAGATFYFLPFHHFLWQAPGLESVKGTRTFDLRLWDDVKGQGGFHAVSGTEWQRGVKTGRFNVALHEFAHQVHSFLSGEEKREIKRLFIKAKKEGRTLDYYADMNEFEYLAQGLEAYVSPWKLPDQKDTMGHTRPELSQKDPDLYRFVEGMNRKESYRDNEILALVSRGYTLAGEKKYEEAFAVLKNGESQYGSHPSLLRARADFFAVQGLFPEARSLYSEGLRQFPASLELHIDAALDSFFLRRDGGQAIGALESQIAKHPYSSELLNQLGQFYYYDGQLDKMEQTFRRALELDPFPNPYSGYRPFSFLGTACLEKGDYDGAVHHFKHRLEKIDRNDPHAYASLARAFHETGRPDEAKANLDMALKLDSELPLARETQACILMGEGQVDQARSILEGIVKRYPRRIEARLLLAQILMGTDPAGAKKALREGIALSKSEQAASEVILNQSQYEFGLFSRSLISRLYKLDADLAE